MGTGKGSVARELGRLLARPVIDTDSLVESMAGLSISQIFSQSGEEAFRRLETQALEMIQKIRGSIISTGGGAPLAEGNSALLRQCGRVVLLTAEPGEIARRIRLTPGGPGSRPLLAGAPDRLEPRLRELLRDREGAYRKVSHQQVDTTGLSPREVALRIVSLLELGDAPGRGGGTHQNLSEEVKVGHGFVLSPPGDLLPSSLRGRRGVLVTDPLVGSLYEERVRASLAKFVDLETLYVPPGERAKSLPQVEDLYRSFLNMGLGRDGVVIALGGGAVGDVAGFAAATFMRGIPHVQIPTTLLSQVDSSLGGKTGVNLEGHKNLVGSFHQPSLLLADAEFISTLGFGEIRSGLAEVLKYGFTLDRELLNPVLKWGGPLGGEDPAFSGVLEEENLVPIVKRCLALKADIVARDEREGGLREVLNFGHTLGHAVESLTGMKHGEAVSVGMCFAAFLGEELGMSTRGIFTEVRQAVTSVGLPSFPLSDLEARDLAQRMKGDKKARGGRVRMILISDLGTLVPSAVEVSPDQLEGSLGRWLARQKD